MSTLFGRVQFCPVGARPGDAMHYLFTSSIAVAWPDAWFEIVYAEIVEWGVVTQAKCKMVNKVLYGCA
eukprot:SAG31_NODE_13955_length_835_cov_0.957880_2_plen_68_part_00